MQTKIFSKSSTRLLENEINTWLTQNNDKEIIDIKFSSHSSVTGNSDWFSGDDTYSAMIIYKDGEE